MSLLKSLTRFQPNFVAMSNWFSVNAVSTLQPITSASSRLNSSASNPNWVSSFVQPGVKASGKKASTTALCFFHCSLSVVLSPTFSPPRVDQLVKSGALSPTFNGMGGSYGSGRQPHRPEDVGIGAAAA